MFTIYGAVSSREPTVIRYVGCTRDVATRVRWLVATASKHPRYLNFRSPVTDWAGIELGAGYDVQLVPLAHTDDMDRAHRLELGYWQALRPGGRLLNGRRPVPRDLVPMTHKIHPAKRRAAVRTRARDHRGRFASNGRGRP